MGNEYLAILGAVGTEGRITKVFEDKKLMGTYKVIRAIIGKELLNIKIINGQYLFKLYLFSKVMK